MMSYCGFMALGTFDDMLIPLARYVNQCLADPAGDHGAAIDL